MQNTDLDSLYHVILKWDYFADLKEQELFTRHLEEDKTWELLLDATKTNVGVQKVPLRFSSSEEYVAIFRQLFLIEARAQLARSKYTEREDSEKFLLNLVKTDEKRNYFNFELLRNVSKNIQYSNGDLILIHLKQINDESQSEHTLAVVDKYTNGIILCRVVLSMETPRCQSLAKNLTKNSEWYITKICNMATITREYQALMSIDDLLLGELLLNPEDGVAQSEFEAKKKEDEYFHIPKKLDRKLKERFNPSQYEAIKSSIKKKGLTLIQGPPGTGKSTTILGILSVILNASVIKEAPDRKNSVVMQLSREMLNEKGKNQKKENILPKTHPWLFQKNPYEQFDNLDFPIDELFTFNNYETDNVKQLLKPSEGDISPPEKILVCAPSNVAIDEIVRKLVTLGLYDNEGNMSQPKFVRIGPNYHPNLKEYSLDYLISQHTQSQGNSSNVEKIRNEILSNAKIVCSTLSMAGSNILTALGMKFDTVVIDEASQAVELSTLIPLKYNCERLILVGDPNQLAATVFSSTALKYNYDQSLFMRFQQAGYNVLVLKTQYRMQAQVSNFISELFYNGLVENDASVYKMAPELISSHPAFQPMTFYDIESEEEFVGTSFYNQLQIDIIVELVKQLKAIYKDDKLLMSKVAVLSPYSKQVNELLYAMKKIVCDKENNNATIEVNTVDGFQGKEKSVIIFSTVRSKGSRTIGFLSDERRINVGLTRAKACLIVVGDSKTLMKDKNWDKLVRYSFRKGTFYKVKGNIKSYFKSFEKNYAKYQAKNEEEFTKLIYSGATGKEVDKS